MNKTSKVATSANRVQAERLQIYEKLADMKESELEEYFAEFSISQKIKHRKASLAESICKSPSNMVASNV